MEHMPRSAWWEIKKILSLFAGVIGIGVLMSLAMLQQAQIHGVEKGFYLAGVFGLFAIGGLLGFAYHLAFEDGYRAALNPPEPEQPKRHLHVVK